MKQATKKLSKNLLITALSTSAVGASVLSTSAANAMARYPGVDYGNWVCSYCDIAHIYNTSAISGTVRTTTDAQLPAFIRGTVNPQLPTPMYRKGDTMTINNGKNFIQIIYTGNVSTNNWAIKKFGKGTGESAPAPITGPGGGSGQTSSTGQSGPTNVGFDYSSYYASLYAGYGGGGNRGTVTMEEWLG